MVASFSNFYGKTWLGFCLNIRKHFFLEFSFLSQQLIFKIPLRLRDRHVFMWQSVKVLNVFNTLTLIQIFWKKNTFFKKLEYSFLVETTKIENTSFLFKTALSEANVKTMATGKCNYHKDWSFASNCFIFLKNLFQF